MAKPVRQSVTAPLTVTGNLTREPRLQAIMLNPRDPNGLTRISAQFPECDGETILCTDGTVSMPLTTVGRWMAVTGLIMAAVEGMEH